MTDEIELLETIINRNMNDSISKIGIKLKDIFGFQYSPVGVYFTENRPENASGCKSKGNGCIVPLIFSSAKGKTVAIDKDTTGFNCSAFYLGYQKWIFDGIENFLSNDVVWGREPERFIKTKEQAKAFVESFVPEELNEKVAVFKPLENFKENEKPEVVIFFANADQLSGLIYQLHYSTPDVDDLVVTRFMSACGAMVTLPFKYKSEGKLKAFWGTHDIAARLRLPKDIMTLSMPMELVYQMYEDIDESFLITENWQKIKERN